MIAYFEPHLLRDSKAELGQTQRTHPVPQWLPIGALRKDSTRLFSSTGHLLENHCQGPRRQTTIFSAILHGYHWALRKRVRSLHLPPSLVASAYVSV